MSMSNNNWEKQVHIHSSMERKKGQFSVFIGRWQPLHDGHKQLFQQVLDDGGNVLILIRDMPPNEKNPFTATQVHLNIFYFYLDFIKVGRVKVMTIPDICSVDFGRGVGYDIVEWIPPAEVANISATKVREQLRQEGKL